MVRPIRGDHMVAHAVQHFPIVAGKRQLVAAFAGCILVDKIATVDEHVCGESQVFRALSSIFGQCDKQQGRLTPSGPMPPSCIHTTDPVKCVLSGCLPAVTMSDHNCRHCASPHEYLR